MLILVGKKTCICNRMGSITLLGGGPSWKQYTFSLPKEMPQQGNSNIFPKILVVNMTDSQSESEASPVKRPRLLDDSNDRPEETSRSKQKSRRRCFQCQTKLELVQQELGSCRCGEYSLSSSICPSNTAALGSVSHTEIQRTLVCSPWKHTYSCKHKL